MVIEYMERDPQLTFGQTWWCTFCGFMAAALFIGSVAGLGGMVFGLFYGLIFAVPATPVLAFIWFMVRQLVGEKAYTCIPFGCVAGIAAFIIFAPAEDWLLAGFLGALAGLVAGLVYWLKARKMERKPVTLAL